MIILGIDGGGTKTELLAVDAQGRPLDRWRGPGTNLHLVGIDGVSEVVVDRARKLLGTGADDSVVVVACMSGVDTDNMRARLHEGLAKREPRWTWLVDNDATAAWWGAFSGRPGVVTIAGTGAVAYAAAGNTVARAGGWGALLGDEGSGYSLGRAAIIAVLRAEDGLGPDTLLRNAVLHALKLHRTQDLVDHVHLMMSHSDVAALAPTVVAIADEGDEVAARLLAETADSLVELAEAAANRVRTDRAGLMDAAFVGGLARRPQIRQLVEKRLKGSTVCHWREPVATAAVGAVVLGGSRTGHLAGWDDDTLDRMIAATEEQ